MGDKKMFCLSFCLVESRQCAAPPGSVVMLEACFARCWRGRHPVRKSERTSVHTGMHPWVSAARQLVGAGEGCVCVTTAVCVFWSAKRNNF